MEQTLYLSADVNMDSAQTQITFQLKKWLKVSNSRKIRRKNLCHDKHFAHEENIDGLEDYLRDLEGAGVSGIIVADPLIIETCRRVAPKLEVHLSTQQSLSNWKAVQFWKEEGLERVVLARETSALEIRK